MYAGVQPALAALLQPVLAPGAVLVVETSARTRAELPWRVVREKRYGDTRVTFLVAGKSRPRERTTMMQRQPEPAGALDAT